MRLGLVVFRADVSFPISRSIDSSLGTGSDCVRGRGRGGRELATTLEISSTRRFRIGASCVLLISCVIVSCSVFSQFLNPGSIVSGDVAKVLRDPGVVTLLCINQVI